MFGCYGIFLGGLLYATGRDGEALFMIAISTGYTILYFGLSGVLIGLDGHGARDGRIAAGGDLDVAKVTLSDRDGSYAPAQVVAKVTDRPEEVERSLNKGLASLGYMAVASDLADQAATAYAAGKKDESLSLLRASTGIAAQNAARFDDDSLRKQAATLEEQRVQYDAAAPESEEGQHAVKQNKATGRAWSR